MHFLALQQVHLCVPLLFVNCVYNQMRDVEKEKRGHTKKRSKRDKYKDTSNFWRNEKYMSIQ